MFFLSACHPSQVRAEPRGHHPADRLRQRDQEEPGPPRVRGLLQPAALPEEAEGAAGATHQDQEGDQGNSKTKLNRRQECLSRLIGLPDQTH